MAFQLAEKIPQATVSLRRLAVTALRIVVDHLKSRPHPSDDQMNELLAGALNDLSNRHSNLGHKDEALAAIEEAVEIRRKLAESYPQIFLSPLIRSLHIQSEILIELGRESEAQSVKDEIARQLRGPD